MTKDETKWQKLKLKKDDWVFFKNSVNTTFGTTHGTLHKEASKALRLWARILIEGKIWDKDFGKKILEEIKEWDSHA